MLVIYFIISILLLLAALFISTDMIISILFVRVPSLSSRGAVIKKIKSDPYFKDIFTDGKTLYDLGCGRGISLIALTRAFNVKSTGYELNPAVFAWAKVRRLLSGRKVRKNLHFKFGNFFKIDLSKADIIYLYLFPEIVLKLEDKIIKECRPGTYIICNTFVFQTLMPVWKHEEKGSLKNIYVYKI